MIQDFDYQNCIGPLLDWFEGHARVLPWRSDPSPYRVWISEIMLQQTLFWKLCLISLRLRPVLRTAC